MHEVVPVVVHTDWDDDYEDLWMWWSDPDELVAYEESLPDGQPDGWWMDVRDEDAYDDLWFRVADWDDPIDDSPAWAAVAQQYCARCGQRDDLDPLGSCSECRWEDGRCSWCGLDPVVYESDRACRAGYQRLRRMRVTRDLRLRLSMLEAAFRRADQRKRRAHRT